ncbi:hypothetical protein JKP88DRAFT_242442 [Tribonema minus]|uniref:histone acetyltransferase n=1 Tax=Tribonema minus TaxID=303371 RepID=A0A836C832_9STRA|nr:hypothetical protein JKP88DRAFT_242442 [Tribonema minus]
MPLFNTTPLFHSLACCVIMCCYYHDNTIIMVNLRRDISVLINNFWKNGGSSQLTQKTLTLQVVADAITSSQQVTRSQEKLLVSGLEDAWSRHLQLQGSPQPATRGDASSSPTRKDLLKFMKWLAKEAKQVADSADSGTGGSQGGAAAGGGSGDAEEAPQALQGSANSSTRGSRGGGVDAEEARHALQGSANSSTRGSRGGGNGDAEAPRALQGSANSSTRGSRRSRSGAAGGGGSAAAALSATQILKEDISLAKALQHASDCNEEHAPAIEGCIRVKALRAHALKCTSEDCPIESCINSSHNNGYFDYICNCKGAATYVPNRRQHRARVDRVQQHQRYVLCKVYDEFYRHHKQLTEQYTCLQQLKYHCTLALACALSPRSPVPACVAYNFNCKLHFNFKLNFARFAEAKCHCAACAHAQDVADLVEPRPTQTRKIDASYCTEEALSCSALSTRSTEACARHVQATARNALWVNLLLPLLKTVMNDTKNPDGIFNRPVTEADAPGCKDVISHPMDFGTIEQRGRGGFYAGAPKRQSPLKREWSSKVQVDAKRRAVCRDCPAWEKQHCCTICGYQCLRTKPVKHCCNTCGTYIATNKDMYMAPDASRCCGGGTTCGSSSTHSVGERRPVGRNRAAARIRTLAVEDGAGERGGALSRRQVAAGGGVLAAPATVDARAAAALRTGSVRGSAAAVAGRLEAQAAAGAGGGGGGGAAEHGGAADAAARAGGGSGAAALPFTKERLVKLRAGGGVSEDAVQCNACGGWEHCACALFNPRAGSTNDQYACSAPRRDVPAIIRRAFRAGPGAELPPAIDYIIKAIGLFALIDGVDVCVLMVYVYEYGPDAPACNARSVYIAYVDSIEYLYPGAVRSQLYQELIAAYLEHARLLGYDTAYLWSSPPQMASINYIWWQRPAHQKMPSVAQLRGYYNRVFQRCNEYGTTVATERTNLYAARFAAIEQAVVQGGGASVAGTGSEAAAGGGQGGVDCRPVAPVLIEGDCWPSELMRLVRQRGEERRKDRAAAAGSYAEELRALLLRLCAVVKEKQESLFVVPLARPGQPLEDASGEDMWQAAVRTYGSAQFRANAGECADPDAPLPGGPVDAQDTCLQALTWLGCQTDTLRLAKYTTAMLLYHCHRVERNSLNPRCNQCVPHHPICNSLGYRCTPCAYQVSLTHVKLEVEVSKT